MHHKLSITDLPIKGKKVLMRVDFNVPMDKSGNITDLTRIEASIPSIRYVLDKGGSVILMSHLGRPKGKPAPEFSLAPCAKALEKLLGVPVAMAPDCVGSSVAAMAEALKPGQVVLLENLRFHKGEENPDEEPEFARQLAALGDCYVNDAFGTAHRAHASTFTVPYLVHGGAAAGLLLQREIEFFEPLIFKPTRPFYAIIGGAKISTKIGVLKALLKKVDGLLIGGAMAYTFLKAKGIPIGDSLYEEELVPQARKILEEAEHTHVKLLLPIDHVVANKVAADATSFVVAAAEGIPPGQIGVDIGPATIKLFIDSLRGAKTIFWNGPLGVFEVAPFAEGTKALAKALTTLDATTVVGGGDSVAALHAVGDAGRISHVSTGGGAALEFIEFGTLPGIEALSGAGHFREKHAPIIL